MLTPFETRSPIQAGSPTTFAERGVAVPFTTPALLGTRVRPADRGGTELVMPNPSGGRGAYVLGWGGLGALCRLTVHDTRLVGRLRTLARVTPDAVRDAAWGVAAEGFAGPEARIAAGLARQADRDASAAARTALLTLLIRQTGTRAPEATATDTVNPARAVLLSAELARQRRGFAGGALGIGPAGDRVAAAIEHLAQLFAPLGLGKVEAAARLPRLIDRIDRMQDDLAHVAPTGRDEGLPLAGLVASTARVTTGCAAATLAAQRAQARDVVGLLHRWSTAPDRLADELARTGWLLDGWEQIVLLWSAARHAAERREAIAVIAAWLPALPQEADAWLGNRPPPTAPARRRSPPPMPDRHAPAAVFERIARNEELRACAA